MIQNNILINTETRKIKKQDYDFIGVAGENKVEQLVMKLTAFIDGVGIIEIQKNSERYFIELDKHDECYVLDIKNSLLSDSEEISMQLHITNEYAEVFKSKIFTMKVYEQIHATESIPDEYPEWIDYANARLQHVITECEGIKNECEELKEGIEDLTTAFQFPSFDVEGGRVAVIQIEKMRNTNFGVEEGRIYKEVHI